MPLFSFGRLLRRASFFSFTDSPYDPGIYALASSGTAAVTALARGSKQQAKFRTGHHTFT